MRLFTVNRGVDQSHSGTAALGVFADRPDQIADPFQTGPVLANPDPACHLTSSQGGRAADRTRTVQNWFNPCAFAAPTGAPFGTAHRNDLTGPRYSELDLSLRKSFSLYQGHQFQVRSDVFNAFNHPNFDLPNRVFDSAAFSTLQSANTFGNRPPRQIQFALRYGNTAHSQLQAIFGKTSTNRQAELLRMLSGILATHSNQQSRAA